MRRRSSIAVLSLLGLMIWAFGCTKPNLEAVGLSYLFSAFQEELYEHFETGFVLINGATVSAEDRLTAAVRDDDRFPEWARGEYDVCVYWEDAYTLRMLQGPMRKGIVQAWVLVANDLSKHILEISLVSDETGERVMMVDQWDGPVEVDDTETDGEGDAE